MENTNTPTETSFDLLKEIQWFFAGFILMLGSSKFYKRSVKKSTGIAILSFMLFMLVYTGLTTSNLILAINQGKEEIEQAFIDGRVPVITIQDGAASSSGPAVYDYIDQEGMLVRVDLTGGTTEIDRENYYQGFLLTKTELHVLNNNGQYEVISLSDLNTAFETNPIIIDSDTVSEMINFFATVGMVVFFIMAAFWNCIVRFLYMVGLGLILWGFTSMMEKTIDFKAILILGCYAYLGSMLYTFVASQVGVSFAFLHTIIMLVIWVLHISLVLQSDQENEIPNLPMAFVGIPFLISVVYSYLQTGYAEDWLKITVITTFLVTVGLIFFFEYRQDDITV